jgi:hypothetical protein
MIHVQTGVICKQCNNEYKHLKQYDKRLVVLHVHQPFIMKQHLNVLYYCFLLTNIKIFY